MAEHDPERAQEQTWKLLNEQEGAINAVLAALSDGRFLHKYEAHDPKKQVARSFIERLDSAGFVLIRKGW